ncbi:MAG TPA: amidase, partial [Myxococcaceae bacterium]|nr:amidase [Myxococcaceae bacterium]
SAPSAKCPMWRGHSCLPSRQSCRDIFSAASRLPIGEGVCPETPIPVQLWVGEPMSKSRRQFLSRASIALAATSACRKPVPKEPPAGAPPAFGTAPEAGPAVSPSTFAEAEKLVQVELTPAERDVAAASWRRTLASVYERRTGPRKLSLDPSLAPATRWDPVLPGQKSSPDRDRFIRTPSDPAPFPANDQDLAFAPLTHLSRWIETRKLTSERLTRLYLDRLEKFDPKLRCVITLLREQALAQATQADREIATGKYRGPLHGIPWGAKDLVDTAGIPTTYGAEPFRNRVPSQDAAVVKRLHDAGAVLVAKLSLGALALNDIWFGGQTMNPWLLEEGASGSSAGPGAATSAGLVAFSIGSETGGSIVSPSMRCGITGLRPTYGRVPRTGAMTLCWSLDKLGPMTRGVEDAMLVLRAISGPDPGDVASVPSRLDFDGAASVQGLRLGYFPAWMKEAPATDVDRAALETARKLGMTPVEVSLPDWPYGSLNLILFAEGAAAFEELTLSGGLKQLKAQVPDAWPNLFRQARFLSAVDFVQTDRLRRSVAQQMARIFAEVDLLLVPSLRDEMLTISNFTGHPSLTLRAGFVEVSEARSDWAPDPANPLPRFSPPRRVPHGITLIGRLFDEGTIARAGIAFERAFGVAAERPPGF